MFLFPSGVFLYYNSGCLMKDRRIIISVCILLVITTVAFLPSLRNGFTNWDDDIYVTENPKIRELSWEKVGRIFASTHHGCYKPLTELSFAVDYHFFRLNPAGYHAVNLVLHLLNCLLVFWFLLRLSRNVPVAFIGALLFGVHPLHVESVAWVSERKDMLYGLFSLLSLIAYLSYLRKRSSGFYWLSLFLFFISLLPKPQGILFPLVLFLLDYFEGRRFDRKAVLEKTPFFLVSVLFVIITSLSQSEIGFFRHEKFFTGLPSLMNGAYGLVFYLLKLAAPVRLSALYPQPAGSSFLYLLSPAILASLVAVTAYSGRYGKKVIFAGLFFLFNILVVLQVISTGPAIAADRYVYLPSIAVFWLAGEGLVWLYERGTRWGLLLLLIGIVGCFSLLTRQRCLVWKESRTLWEDVLGKYPDVALAHNNIGTVLAAEDRVEEASFHYRRALRLQPDYAEAHGNLGLILVRQGRFEEGIFHYREALRIKPGLSKVINNLGTALARQGRFEEAIPHFSDSLRLQPENAAVHYNLARALRKLGKDSEAAKHFKAARELGLERR